MEELRCELIFLLTDEPTCVRCMMEWNDLTIKILEMGVEARFLLLLHHRLYKIEWASMQVPRWFPNKMTGLYVTQARQSCD